MRYEAKLNASKPLSPAAHDALLASIWPSQIFRRASQLQYEGEAADVAYLILEGLAVTHRTLQDGGRQIVALHFPGDWVGLSDVICGHNVQGLTAITPVTAARLPKDALLKLIETHAELSALFTNYMVRDARIAQEWLVGLGRRSAYARTAHLICEIALRHAETESPVFGRYPFPLTQVELADVLGLSIVHVNRVFQRLRREGLIVLASSSLTILSWSGLVKAAGFEGTYLAPSARMNAEPWSVASAA